MTSVNEWIGALKDEWKMTYHNWVFVISEEFSNRLGDTIKLCFVEGG